jgi:uncharacterized protein (DUF58 family)
VSLVSRYLDPALIERLNHLSLSAKSVVEGATTGVHRSPVKGASIDFRQHRFYVPGDEPRRLDWRVLARTDRPYIREYDEETNLRAVLLLDCSGSMAYGGKAGTKFDYAARMIASLAYLMLGQTESVGLCTFSSRMENWTPPRPGTPQLSRIIDTLERCAAKGDSALPQVLHSIADRLDRRALVIVLSDFFVPIAPVREGLAHLVHDRHEVLVMQVLDDDEQAFPFRNWSRFRGLEGEKPQLCEPAVVRKTYLDNFRRHRKELEAACSALKIEFHAFVTETPLADALTRFLARRQGMR